jgi:hypothetical protein
MASLNYLSTPVNPQDRALQEAIQSGNAVGRLVNPKAFSAAPADATPTLSKTFKPNRSTKSKAAGPLSKEKTDDQKAQDVSNEVFKELTPKSEFEELLEEVRGNKVKGEQGKVQQNVYGTSLPNSKNFNAASAQAVVLNERALGGEEKIAEAEQFNNQIKLLAMQDYLKKASNPFRGVDLESMDRTMASTFGGRVQGLKNVTEPTNEFNQLVGAGHYIQKMDGERAKNIQDYAEKMLAPKLLGTVGLQDQQIRTGGGRTSAQEQSSQKYVADKWLKLSAEHAKKDQILGQIKGNLKNGGVTDLNATAVLLAKGVGTDVGNTAVKESSAYVPSTFGGDIRKMFAYLADNPTAQASPDIVNAINQYVAVYEREWSKRKELEKGNLNKTLNNLPAFSGANSKVKDIYTTPAAPAQAPAGGKKVMSPSEWLKAKG